MVFCETDNNLKDPTEHITKAIKAIEYFRENKP